MRQRAAHDRGSRLALSFDIGGTFTDFTLVDLATGRVIAEHKTLTDLVDPAASSLAGWRDLVTDGRLRPEELAFVVHATTLVTNTVIERTAARDRQQRSLRVARRCCLGPTVGPGASAAHVQCDPWRDHRGGLEPATAWCSPCRRADRQMSAPSHSRPSRTGSRFTGRDRSRPGPGSAPESLTHPDRAD